MFRLLRSLLLVVLLAAPAAPLMSQSRPLDSTLLAAFRWRNVGPANTMGRIADIAGIPSPSRTFYVASVAGGIFKTTNGGVTFRPLFDHERVVAMGALAIAPSDTMQIWAGTGEQNSRNSISPGGGIYKSTDAGLTWKNMGLKETQIIGRIMVHPTNPDIVWVAALGAPWNANVDRGVYKTTDGGKSWRKVKYISDKAGFVDLVIDPSNPDVLFASSYERMRGPYYLTSGGPGSALWKSTDAGETWNEVKGGGFPSTMKGRIGLAIAASNPKVMYALVEADSMPNPKGKKGVGKAAPQLTGLYRSDDAGATWTRTATTDVRPFYYSQVRVDPKNPDRVYWSSTPVNFSDDGGKTVRQTTVGVHVDHHAMWIDPNDPNRIVVGDDGGVAESFDHGGNWLVLNSIAISQLYDVSYDYAIPYNVCGGLQDNGAWCGPSRRKSGPITNSMWFTVNGGDGFYTAQDPTDPHIVYAESQGGGMARINTTTGESTTLAKPNARTQIAEMEDTIAVILDDSAHANTAAAKKRLADLRAAIQRDSIDFALRWNWETPFFLSPHDPHTFYAGSNRVMKSTERGEHMYPISPDLTYADSMKIRISTRTTGGITTDATGAETFPTIVSLAESYIRPGLLYAGTDDGRTWLTRNGGGSWEELTGRMPGVPAGTYVSRIEPSHSDTSTFYISFDNHRTGDYTPYLYVTHDYGKTFQSLVHDLPTGGPDYVHVVREDPAFANVLFVGTETGCYVSTNGGATWQRFMAGLPTVPVYDLKIHPRDRELIAATHGRSVWIVDINALGQIVAAPTSAALTVLKPKPAFEYGEPLFDGQSTGQGVDFRGQSPTYGADIEYLVATASAAGARVAIMNALGDTIRTIDGSGAAGLQRVVWDFRITAPPAPRVTSPSARRDSITRAQRVVAIFDSLRKTGADTAALGRIQRQLARGDSATPAGGRGAGGGGRGRGNADVWAERPGESAAGRGAGGGGGGGRGRGGAELSATGADSALTQTVNDLLPPAAGRGGRGGAGGFGGANLTAAPGQYAVVVRVGSQVGKVLLTVERSSGEGNGGGIQADDKTFRGDGGSSEHLSVVQWITRWPGSAGASAFGAAPASVQSPRSLFAWGQRR